MKFPKEVSNGSFLSASDASSLLAYCTMAIPLETGRPSTILVFRDKVCTAPYFSQMVWRSSLVTYRYLKNVNILNFRILECFNQIRIKTILNCRLKSELKYLRLSQDLVWRGLSSECFWSVLLVWGRWVHQGTCLLFDRSRFWLSSFQAILLCRLEHLALLRPCFAPGNWRRQSKEGNWCFGIWRLIAVSSVWRWSRYRTWRKDWTRRFLKRHKAACQRKDW